MEILDINKQEPEFFDPLGSGQVDNKVPPNAARIMSEYYAHVLTRDPRDVEQDIVQGMDTMLRNEANGQADARKAQSIEARLRTAISQEEDPQAVLDELRATTTFGQYLVPQVSVLLEGGDVADEQLRLLDRVLRAEELLAIQRESQSQGITATLGYFGDIMVSDPLQSIVGGLGNLVGAGEETFEEASQRRELAKEVNDLLLSDVSPEEFDTQFASIIARISDAGFLSENNPLILNEFIEMVQEGGEGKVSQAATAFQVLDVATAGVGTAVVKGSQRVGNLPKSVAKIRGREAGVETIVRAADEGRPGPIVAEMEPSLTRMANADETYLSAPDLDAMRQLEATNAGLQFLRRNDGPAFTDPRILKAKMGDIITDIRERSKAVRRHELDVDVVDDGLGNILGRVVLGKSDRSLYKSQEKAQELATRIGGEVRETVDGGVKRFVVVKEYNVSTEGLARATDLGQISDGFLTGITSTTRTTTSYLDGVLKWGEATNARNIKAVAAQYRQASSQASKVERNRVSSIFEELRDDPLHSWRKEPYSRSEFIDRYMSKFDGEMPSEQALELWRSVAELNDIDYYLNADVVLKEAVNNGETMLRLDGEFFRAKAVDVPEDVNVYNVETGKWVKPNEDLKVYEIKDFAYAPEGVGAIQFVGTRNPVERRLFHSDVMNYNVGGHRVYTQPVTHFLKQEGAIVLGDGRTVTRTPKTFMGVRSAEEAREVMESWNRIADAIASEADNVDDIVKANSRWHSDIEDAEDFIREAEKLGISPAQRITMAADGEPTVAEGLRAASWAGEDTVGGHFRNSFNNRARTDTPLMGFGGDPLRTLDPIRAMERGFAYSLNRQADNVYLNQASKGLIRTIEKLEKRGESHVLNWADLNGKDLRIQIRDMQFKDTDIGRKLAQEHAIIMRVLNRNNADQQTVKKALDNAAAFVYGRQDTLAKIVGKKNAKRLSESADALAELDYAGFIRSAAFHTKLGALSLDQAFIQASQTINATFIASANLGVPGAIRAAAGGHWLQMAIAASDDVAERLAKSQSAITGVSVDDFLALRQWVKQTGRGIIDRTVVEENRDAVIGAGKRAQIANLSTTFFRGGEVNARMSAAMLNMAEMRAKGFKGDIFSDATTRRMIARQDVLTASMTAKSSAPWQRSIMAIPLQFMTYNARIMEQLFTPDVLSNSERIRLGLAHLVLYGGAAIPGAGYLMDKYGYDGGYGSETGIYHGIRYGAMDAALSQLTEALGGKETALSTRIGVGDGLFQFLEDTGSEGLIDLAIGPGGQVILDVWSALGQTADGLFSESWDATGYDLNRFARIFSSYDDGFKLWAAIQYGEYWTRTTGTTTMTGLNTTDGILQMLGVPLADQNRLWSTIQFEQQRRENYEKVYKEVEELSRLAARKLEGDDFASYKEVMDDIAFVIHGLPSSQRQEAVRRIRRTQDLPAVLIDRIVRRGDIDLADRLRKDFE